MIRVSAHGMMRAARTGMPKATRRFCPALRPPGQSRDWPGNQSPPGLEIGARAPDFT